MTSCPGEQLYYQLPELRERVGERRPTGDGGRDGGPAARARHVLARRRTPSPARSPTPTGCRGRARAWSCSGCGARAGSGSRSAVTDENGNFAATATFKRYTILRWEFEGDDTYRPFRGDGVAVAVAPLHDARRLDDRRRRPMSGSTCPGRSPRRRRTELTLVVQRYDEDGGRWRRVARQRVTAERRRLHEAAASFGEAGRLPAVREVRRATR